MIKKQLKEHYVPMMLIIGVISSSLFLTVGYLISGAFPSAIDPEGKPVGFAIKLLDVLAHPFQTHYNRYTPIVMLLSFVVFELLFFLLMVMVKGKTETEEKKEPVVDSVLKKEKDIEVTKSLELEETFVEKEEPSGNREVEEQVASISEDLFMDLSGKYSIDQITEMMKISKYIGRIDATLLTKMFRPSMSADEIQSYIKMFYG